MLDAFEARNGFDPNTAGEGAQDADGDGLDNLAEQSAGTDPREADTDGDDLSDADEPAVYGTDPTRADTDGDGMEDGFEVAYGFDPLAHGEAYLDPDDDGMPNRVEGQRGTDPSDPDSDGDGRSDGDEAARSTSESFGPQRGIDTLPKYRFTVDSIFAADLDGDGDRDVLATSATDRTIGWYENRLREPGRTSVRARCSPIGPASRDRSPLRTSTAMAMRTWSPPTAARG